MLVFLPAATEFVEELVGRQPVHKIYFELVGKEHQRFVGQFGVEGVLSRLARFGVEQAEQELHIPFVELETEEDKVVGAAQRIGKVEVSLVGKGLHAEDVAQKIEQVFVREQQRFAFADFAKNVEQGPLGSRVLSPSGASAGTSSHTTSLPGTSSLLSQ